MNVVGQFVGAVGAVGTDLDGSLVCEHRWHLLRTHAMFFEQVLRHMVYLDNGMS